MIAFFVSGCRLNPRSDEDAAQVRLINAVPDAEELNISVNGQRVWKRSLFHSNTGYKAINAGSYPVRLEASRSAVTLQAQSLSFRKKHRYTMLALGQVQSHDRPAELQVTEDYPRDRTREGKAAIRLVNAASSLARVDLVVNNIVGLKSVDFGKRSQALTLDADTYDFKIVATDTSDALMPPIHLRLESGRSYLLVTMGQASTQTLTLEVYPDAH